MRHAAHRLSLTLATALLVFASAPDPAAAATGHAYGALRFDPGHLRSLAELPPGPFKRQVQALSPQAQANALRWLQKVSITGSDLDTLRVDVGGGVYVVDDQAVPGGVKGVAAKAAPTGGNVSANFAPSDAFSLHSKPGAANRVYLDFNGHSFSNTAWGAGTFNAVAFSTDIDRFNFSDSERAIIVEIWHRVAEDYAPFDIDVTTEDPVTFNSRTGRVVITEDQQSNGTPMPSQGAGGVAYLNVFGASNYASYYSPALVYAENLGPNSATYVSEATSHEFGHNLGLSHDGTTGGTTYYTGQGSGLVSWAPIMGNSYYNNVTEFSKGEYSGANQTQDDLAIIASKLSYRPDDHGNAIGSGSALQIATDGTVDSSNPELDPHNLLPQNKGIINSATDVDVFTFTSGAGPLTLSVTPAWDAFARTTRRGANLDASLELRNSTGGVVASNDPSNDTRASISATVAAGTYHLFVGGAGNTVTPYSDYASVGEYFINGSVTAGGVVVDTTAPNPNPMSFAAAPAATSTSAIAMTASTASDPSGGVQYRFNCVAGGTGCVASAWQSSAGYTATGLAASTSYSFTVQARDALGNTTAASSVASATTQSTPPPPPSFTLTARGYRVAGRAKVELNWSNQPVGKVDIYRNNVKVQSNRSGTSYVDPINTRGAATYTHKVCTTNTSTCSNTTTTVF